MTTHFRYGTDTLTPSIAIAIANGTCKGVIEKEARQRIEASQQQVNDIVNQGRTVYGINTGFYTVMAIIYG